MRLSSFVQRLRALLPALSLAALATACAPPQQATHLRFLWPPDAREAKVEYVGYLQSDLDVAHGRENWLVESIFGRQQATPIFVQPQSIATADGNRVYVTDAGLRKVHVIDLARKQSSFLLGFDGNDFAFAHPAGIAVAGEDVYVVDSLRHKIYLFTGGKVRHEFGEANLERPTGIAVDAARDRIYVVDTGASRLVVFDTRRNFVTTIGQRGSSPGTFNFPLDVDVDADGNLYVLDTLNARVQALSPQGEFLHAFGERGTAAGSFQIPKALAVSPFGHVYVTDSLANRFVIFDLQGRFLMNLGGKYLIDDKGVSPGGFNMPQGIAVDRTGGIWVVDSLNRTVHRFQYLDEAYLREHPINPAEIFLPD